MENIKALNLNDFTYLMLATLAQESKIIDLRDKTKKTISLPIHYKQIIENILCADNGWKEEFSILIDTQEYFDDHFDWERRLSSTIRQILIDLNKSFEYDIIYDRLLITFTQDEVDTIMLRYPDEELKNIMNHFTNLLVAYIYTREFQEEFYDYSAVSVKKMHDMKNNKSLQQPKKILELFKQNKIE